DRHGRALLIALLACGLSEPHARVWAPWASPEELRIMAIDVDGKQWSSERLGELVELSYAERQTWRLWSLRPCDVPWQIVQADRGERKRARDRNYRKRK